MKFATKAVHIGQEPDPATGAMVPPVYLTTNYLQEDIGKNKGYEYSRSENPSRAALEKSLAALESANHALAFSSGMAAISAAMSVLKPGDSIILPEDLYGGTYRYAQNILANYNIEPVFIDTTNIENTGMVIKSSTKVLWLETPSNPLLKITDLKSLCALAKEKKILTVVDNTFATPYFQNPLLLGADVVVHSMSKYLGGHSDLIGGAIATSNAELHEKFKFVQKSAGAIPSPFDCWLFSRSIKTLPLRMEKHADNAQRVADYLASNPKVAKVFYPGLKDHPQHELAKNQMSGFGGVVSLEVPGGAEAARKVMKSTRLFKFAESLGGIESIVCQPATSSHASMPEKLRQKLGITDGLLRLSVGIEDGDDLIADIKNALQG